MPPVFDSNFRLFWIHDESGPSGIPSGYSRDNLFDERTIQGSTSGGIIGGGSGHNHSIPEHGHTSQTHIHYIISFSTTVAGIIPQHYISLGLIFAPNVTHSHQSEPIPSASINYNTTNPSGTDVVSEILPQRITTIIIKPDSELSSIPSGIVAFTDESTPPDGFVIASGINDYPNLSDLFFIGAVSGQNGGDIYAASGGHSHTTSGNHVHGAANHSHSATLCGAPRSFGTTTGFSFPGYSHPHHHNIEATNTSSPDANDNNIVTDASASGLEPAYTKLLSIQTTGTDNIPPGLIFGYIGASGDLDSDNWDVCDGNGDTLDLSDTHIKATTNNTEIGDNDGSTNNHTHESSHNHTTTGTHNHPVSATFVTTSIERNSNSPTKNTFNTSHTHVWSCSADAGGVINDADLTTTSGDHRGPWRTMIWVKSKEVQVTPYSGSIDLFIGGYDTVFASGDLFIGGQEQFNNSVDLFIDGHIETISSGDLWIGGLGATTESIDLFIGGFVSTSGSQVPLFIHGNNVSSGSTDLFIHGYDSFVASGDLFIQGHEPNVASGDLFVGGFSLASGNVPLFINGYDDVNGSHTLFIEGLDNIFVSGDLFINGHSDNNSSCDLFIGGYTEDTASFDLFIEGHTDTSGTQTPPLFICGHEGVSGSCNLFVHGYNDIDYSCDLYIKGYTISAISGDLFIRGFSNTSGSNDLFIDGYQSDDNSLDLVIMGFQPSSGNTDLFIRGLDELSSNIDLFIGELDVASGISGNIDLYVCGYDISSESCPLFIHGDIDSSGNITLFTEGNESSNKSLSLIIIGSGTVLHSGTIPLIINGYEPIPDVSCPILDPTASIQISSNLIEIYQGAVDSMINQVGKNVILQFDPIISQCPNCKFDAIRNRSSGKYKVGGPVPFDYGRKCPYCKGHGVLKETTELCIKCLISWNPSEIIRFGISVEKNSEVIKLKAYIEDAVNIKRADIALIDRQVIDLVKYKARLIKGPYPLGLREDKYCISFWRTV